MPKLTDTALSKPPNGSAASSSSPWGKTPDFSPSRVPPPSTTRYHCRICFSTLPHPWQGSKQLTSLPYLSKCSLGGKPIPVSPSTSTDSRMPRRRFSVPPCQSPVNGLSPHLQISPLGHKLPHPTASVGFQAPTHQDMGSLEAMGLQIAAHP